MAADFFGSGYFYEGYFPEAYFGTGEADDPNALRGLIVGTSTCTGTLTSATNEDERRAGGVGRKRRAPIVDMIWRDDPRHPNYVSPVAPTVEPQPPAPRSNVIRVSTASMRKSEESKREEEATPNYDVEIALLLLAA